MTMTKTIMTLGVLLVFACGKESKSGFQIVQGWKQAGLEPSAFTKAETKLGGSCQAGTVSGIDTVLCEFKDDQTAKAAEPKGLEIVGETTGASLAKGRMLLVVADRKDLDPNGRRIDQITRSFRR
jgi:hypothetical protein